MKKDSKRAANNLKLKIIFPMHFHPLSRHAARANNIQDLGHLGRLQEVGGDACNHLMADRTPGLSSISKGNQQQGYAPESRHEHG